MTEEKHRRPIRSFVRREGRITKAQKQALETLLPLYGLTCHSGIAALLQSDIRKPVVLEIGFGMGQSLLENAKAQPQHDFIGIEVHRPGVGNLLAQLHEACLRNIRIFNEDAVIVLEQAIPDNSLSGVQIFFPDPWPKH